MSAENDRVRVFIRDHTGTKVREVRIAATVVIADVLPALVNALRLPVTDPSGRPITYNLAWGDETLPGDASLADTRVVDGTELHIVPEMVAGGPSSAAEAELHTLMSVVTRLTQQIEQQQVLISHLVTHGGAPRHRPRDLVEFVLTVDAPSITRVHVTGLRGLRDVSFRVHTPDTPTGTLLVLIGENGLGKTTLLRAIAFALVPPAVANAFVTTSLAPFIAEDSGEARCEVDTTAGPFVATLRSHDGAEEVASNEAPVAHPFVVAYGCRRGSAIGSSLRGVDSSPADDIDNLFDRPQGLINAEAWFAQLRAASNSRGDDAWRLYENVRRAVTRVLPGVIDLDIEPDRRLWATLRDGAQRKTRVASLGDGYLTTAGWVIDLMARWVERETTRFRRKVAADFCEAMTGFVLVDEIDLHLHPVWQTHVLRDLRRVFPRLHFVVTTHNPLTLTGARPGEIYVVSRDPDTGDVRVEDPGYDPRLRTGSDLYANFFGIKDFYPAEEGRKLHEYIRLASDRERSTEDDAKALQLLKELRDVGLDPGFEPEPRVSEPGPGEAAE